MTAASRPPQERADWRRVEIVYAVDDVLEALGINERSLRPGQRDMLIHALAQFRVQVRRPWPTRERELFVRQIVEGIEGEHSTVAKIERLRDNPAATLGEREAAEAALVRIGAS